MALFIRDIKRRVLEYMPGYYAEGNAHWRTLSGEFFDASKDRIHEAINFFHARDFQEIEPYIAAQNLLHDILDVTLDHGVITPNGEYFGLRKNASLDDFVQALTKIKDRLPENMEKQVHGYGIGSPWLEVRKDTVMAVPVGTSEAQIRTLEKTGYLNENRISGTHKHYQDVFPIITVCDHFVPDNPDFGALIDICVDLWDEWDAFVKNNKAANASIESIGIENGYSVY